MSVSNLPSVRSSRSENKPLYRLQQYLKEAKVCLTLFRELLVEVKEIVVVLGLIAIFVYGVLQLLKH
jgi:hypothetical protein